MKNTNKLRQWVQIDVSSLQADSQPNLVGLV